MRSEYKDFDPSGQRCSLGFYLCVKIATMKKRILVDMDEVLADVYPKFEAIYTQQTGMPIQKSDYWGQKLYNLPGMNKLREVLHDPGFFADLPVMEGAQEVMRQLNERYEVFIVSAAMEFRNSMPEKRDWMQEHFPFIHWKHIVFCGHKYFIKADFMIDDHVYNLEAFEGKGLLFTATHNIHEERFDRVDNWQEVLAFFKKDYEADGTSWD